LAGCGSAPLLQNILGGSAAPTQPSQLLVDDFSETKSGWDQFSGAIGSTLYADKTYRIAINEANTDLFATPGKLFRDAAVEVTAARVDGPTNNSFGVICRYKDPENFYSGQISSDGYAGIFRRRAGGYKLLGHATMIPVPAILGGTAPNRIRLVCAGTTLTLFVNNQQVDTIQDKSFDTGDVGLIAGAFDQPGVVVSFDDLVVTQP
jgi:hypothetical protein